jgi:hypothetical protein
MADVLTVGKGGGIPEFVFQDGGLDGSKSLSKPRQKSPNSPFRQGEKKQAKTPPPPILHRIISQRGPRRHLPLDFLRQV